MRTNFEKISCVNEPWPLFANTDAKRFWYYSWQKLFWALQPQICSHIFDHDFILKFWNFRPIVNNFILDWIVKRWAWNLARNCLHAVKWSWQREERDNLVQFYKPFQSPLISSVEHETGTHTWNSQFVIWLLVWSGSDVYNQFTYAQFK